MPLSVWLPSFTVFHNKFIILIKQTNEGRCCNKIWGNTSELYERCSKLGGLVHGGLIRSIHVASEHADSVPGDFYCNNATPPGQRNSKKDYCVSVHSDPKCTDNSFLQFTVFQAI